MNLVVDGAKVRLYPMERSASGRSNWRSSVAHWTDEPMFGRDMHCRPFQITDPGVIARVGPRTIPSLVRLAIRAMKYLAYYLGSRKPSSPPPMRMKWRTVSV